MYGVCVFTKLKEQVLNKLSVEIKEIREQLHIVFFLCEGEGVSSSSKRDWGGIPVSPFKIGLAVAYTIQWKNSA